MNVLRSLHPTMKCLLLQEYNYVKRIISNLAGKQLRHLVLLGGDADCFQLLEVALTDGVACELLYQPEGVDVKSYLPGTIRDSSAAMSDAGTQAAALCASAAHMLHMMHMTSMCHSW